MTERVQGAFYPDDNLKEVGEYAPVIDLGHGVTVKFKIVILDEEAPAE